MCLQASLSCPFSVAQLAPQSWEGAQPLEGKLRMLAAVQITNASPHTALRDRKYEGEQTYVFDDSR